MHHAHASNKDDAEMVNRRLALEKALNLCGPRATAKLTQALDDLGEAPRELSPTQQRLSADLGESLALHGLFEELTSLIHRGWSLALFPFNRWEDPFDAIAARGEKGFELLDALDAAGVKFFGGLNPDQGSSPLLSAAKRLDGHALNYFLSKMSTQNATPARLASERGGLAAKALANKAQSALVGPLIESDPKTWAQAVDQRGNGALRAALDNGLCVLAETMLDASPEAIELADPTRCAFSSAPLKTLDLLVKRGVDLNKRGRLGSSALQAAMHAPKGSKALAAKLIALGADPRATDDNGSTPIGDAISAWTWSDMQETLGATPKDLMDSIGTSSTQGVGALSSLLLAMAQGRIRMTSRGQDDPDSRMAEIVRAASSDSRANTAQFIEKGMSACVDSGLPQCLAAFIEIGSQNGVALRAELLASAVSGLPMSEDQEEGRMSCLRLASDMAVDLNEPYFKRKKCDGREKTSLIEQALERVVVNSDPRSQYFEPMARKARLLAELGCDPSRAGDPGRSWSFDPQGVGRGELNAKTRLEFAAIDSLVEAQALRQLVDKAATVVKKPSGLRV